MTKPVSAIDQSPHASGIAGYGYPVYAKLKDSSFGPKVASPAVILIVEDTEDLRCSVAEYLRIAGFDVIEAENAPDAIATIDAGIHIDLVFTDINMPGAIDGAGLAHWLSDNRPLLPIILTSGESCPELERSTPHRRFMRKPYSLD